MMPIPKIGKAALATIIMGLIVNAASAADMTLKLGHLANEQNPWHKASVKFGQELSSLTNGRIEVEVFPNESLGKEIDLINGMQLGTVDMTITGESLQNWAPMAALLGVPYVYKSIEHMDEIATGKIGDQIKAQIIEKVKIRPVAYFARGPRNLTSNRAYLEGKGMVFVKVDDAAFRTKAKNAILKNVKPEIKPIVEALFSS